MAVDPTTLSVRDLRESVGDITDEDELQEILEAEQAGEDRKTAKAAVRKRIRAIAEDEEDAEEDDDGDAEAGDEAEADDGDTEDGDEAEADDDSTTDAAEAATDDAPEVSYPDADATERVIFDQMGAGGTGAGDPPIIGHDTLHLVGDDGPRCGANVGAKADTVQRKTLPEDIEECQNCLE